MELLKRVRRPIYPANWGVPPVLPDYVTAEFLEGPAPGGSREICNPPPTTTDADYHVLTRSLGETVTSLLRDGWTLGGSDMADAERWFASFTKDGYNLIVTERRPFYDALVRATAIAKRLNVLNKEDRIALFKAMRFHLEGAI